MISTNHRLLCTLACSLLETDVNSFQPWCPNTNAFEPSCVLGGFICRKSSNECMRKKQFTMLLTFPQHTVSSKKEHHQHAQMIAVADWIKNTLFNGCTDSLISIFHDLSLICFAAKSVINLKV